MKKILLLSFALMITSLYVSGQSNTPRYFNEQGKLARGNDLTYRYQALTDATGDDTVYVNSPDAFKTVVSINNGDTLNRKVTVGVKAVTVNGVALSLAKCYKYDELIFHFKTGGAQIDTVQFYGNVIVDTTGSSNSKRLIIPKDLTKESYFVRTIFDGTNFVQDKIYR